MPGFTTFVSKSFKSEDRYTFSSDHLTSQDIRTLILSEKARDDMRASTLKNAVNFYKNLCPKHHVLIWKVDKNWKHDISDLKGVKFVDFYSWSYKMYSLDHMVVIFKSGVFYKEGDAGRLNWAWSASDAICEVYRERGFHYRVSFFEESKGTAGAVRKGQIMDEQTEKAYNNDPVNDDQDEEAFQKWWADYSLANKGTFTKVNLTAASRPFLPNEFNSSIEKVRSAFLTQGEQMPGAIPVTWRSSMNQINSIAITSDDAYLIAGDRESLWIYNLENRKFDQVFYRAHEAAILSLAISRDNQYVVSGSECGSIIVHSLKRRCHIHTFPANSRVAINSLVITNDNRYLVSGLANGTLQVFDLLNMEVLFDKKLHDKSINALALNNKGTTLISGSDDKTIQIFALKEGKLSEDSKKIHTTAEVNTLAITPDGSCIIAGESGGLLQEYAIEDENLPRSFRSLCNANESVTALLTLADNSIAVASVEDNSNIYKVRILNMQEMRFTHEYTHNGLVKALALSKKMNCLYSGSYDNSIKIFDINQKSIISDFGDINYPKDKINCTAMTTDESLLVAGLENGYLKIFDVINNRVKEAKKIHEGAIKSIVVIDDDYIISASADQTIKISKIQELNVIQTFKDLHKGPINALSISEDFVYLASGSEDHSLILMQIKPDGLKAKIDEIKNNQKKDFSLDIINIETSIRKSRTSKRQDNSDEKCYRFLEFHKNAITCLAITKDNKSVIVGSADGKIKVLDIRTKLVVNTFENGHDVGVTQLIVSNRSDYIIAGITHGYEEPKKCTRIFSLEKNELIHEFRRLGNYGAPLCYAITQDDKYLIVGLEVGDIEIIDLQKMARIYARGYGVGRPVHKTDIGILSVAVSKDQKFIYTASDDGDIFKQSFIEGSSAKSLNYICGDNSHQTADKEIVEVKSSQKHDLLAVGLASSIEIYDSKKMKLIKKHAFSSDEIPEITFGDTERSPGELPSEIKRFHDTVEDTVEGKQAVTRNDRELVALTLSSSEDMMYLVLGFSDGNIRIYDINLLNFTSWKYKEEISYKDIDIINNKSLTITKDFKYVACASLEDLNIINRISREKKTIVSPHKCTIDAIVVTNDGQYIISGAQNYSIMIFNIEDMKIIYCFEEITRGNITCLRITTDDRYLVAASNDRSIKVIDVKNQIVCGDFPNIHDDFINSIVLTKDDQYIISGSDDKTIKVLDIKTKRMIHSYECGNNGGVKCVEVCRNNQTIFSVMGYAKDVIVHKFPYQNFMFIEADIPAFSPVYDQFFFQILFHQKSVEYFRKGSSSQNYLYPKLSGLYTKKEHWNLLHIFAFNEDPKLLPLICNFEYFRVPFLLDNYNKTPLHYCGSKDFQNLNLMLKYIVDYLSHNLVMINQESKQNFLKESKYEENQKIMEALTDMVPFMIAKMDRRTTLSYLKLCFSDSIATYGKLLDDYGDSERSFHLSTATTLTEGTKNKIAKKGDDQISFKSLALNYDYSITSPQVFELFETLQETDDEELFRNPTISYFVDYFWDKSYNLVVAFSSIQASLMVLISIYVGMGERKLGLEIAILVLTILLILLESIQIRRIKSMYFKQFWNYIDLLQLSLTMTMICSRIAGIDTDYDRDTDDADESNSSLYISWITALVIILGYTRLISFMRLFSLTRNLIQVFVSVLKDMTAFIMILVLIILGFTLVFLQLDRDVEYGSVLYGTYGVMYGNYDDGEYSPTQKLFLAFILFLLNVVLLNMLISIMGDSFDRTQENKAMSNSLTRIEMMQDVMVIAQLFQPAKKLDKNFLMICLPAQGEDEDPVASEWEGRLNMIKKVLRQNEQKITNQFKAEFQEIHRKIDTNFEKITEEIALLKQELVNVD